LNIERVKGGSMVAAAVQHDVARNGWVALTTDGPPVSPMPQSADLRRHERDRWRVGEPADAVEVELKRVR